MASHTRLGLLGAGCRLGTFGSFPCGFPNRKAQVSYTIAATFYKVSLVFAEVPPAKEVTWPNPQSVWDGDTRDVRTRSHDSRGTIDITISSTISLKIL